MTPCNDVAVDVSSCPLSTAGDTGTRPRVRQQRRVEGLPQSTKYALSLFVHCNYSLWFVFYSNFVHTLFALFSDFICSFLCTLLVLYSHVTQTLFMVYSHCIYAHTLFIHSWYIVHTTRPVFSLLMFWSYLTASLFIAVGKLNTEPLQNANKDTAPDPAEPQVRP